MYIDVTQVLEDNSNYYYNDEYSGFISFPLI